MNKPTSKVDFFMQLWILGSEFLVFPIAPSHHPRHYKSFPHPSKSTLQHNPQTAKTSGGCCSSTSLEPPASLIRLLFPYHGTCARCLDFGYKFLRPTIRLSRTLLPPMPGPRPGSCWGWGGLAPGFLGLLSDSLDLLEH